jgi:hypothetical protein
MRFSMLWGRVSLLFVGAATLAIALGTTGQQLSAQQAAVPSPWASAPIDLTGYWVSVVTEDWRWRMVTPPRGAVDSIPVNNDARAMTDKWDPSSDGSCLAYGAGGLMRIPTRLHITWEGENVIKIDTDAGVQTRRLTFDATAQPGPRSLQGFSKASWTRPGGGGRGGNNPGGSLTVVTNNMTAAWLRKNGVPYSENAVMTEHWDRFTAPNGDEWINVTTIIEDPTYLNQPFVTSTHFKKEPDGSKWAPAPCRA